MIPIAEPDLSGNELNYVEECVTSTWISSAGAFIKKFEKSFASFHGMNHATTCSNGTAALHLALAALDLKKGDEVIVPDLTFVSTANVVAFCGATPVLVDVDKETWNIDPEQVQKKITPKTKAIIPVHLFGNPCDMDAIMKIAKEHNLVVIEDCAESLGAKYDDKLTGTFGDIACFSFYGNKTLTTGEGGMCMTNDKALFDKMNLLKNHGMTKEKRYWHEMVAFNYRMTNLQAAIGLAQMERLPSFIKKREEIANTYRELLKDVPGISFQKVSEKAKPVFWMVSIVAEEKDELVKALQKAEIDTRPIFHPLHSLPIYKEDKDYPNSTFISENGLSLPTYTNLTEAQLKEICEALQR